MAWLSRLLESFRAPPTVPIATAVQLAAAECEAQWREGYTLGVAQGQLMGRQALADEIHQEFGLHQAQGPMNADDAARIKVKQVH